MRRKNIIFLIFTICLLQIVSGQKTGDESDKIITITGKVLDQNKLPIAGAVFYLDNVKTSYTTRSDGSYKIKVSSSARQLVVRSSEHGSGESLIDGQSKINFTLPGPGNNSVLTPADAVKRDELPDYNKPARQRASKMNTYNDIYQMIRSEVSGVVVSGRSIQIQQGHSFFGSGTPLFVVNGAIVPNIDFVSPLEVKSIAVLKGSSAAIYGVRGANGVISITLLNGSENEK